MMKYHNYCPPSKITMATASVLLLFATALALAIVFPYQEDDVPSVSSKSMGHASDDFHVIEAGGDHQDVVNGDNHHTVIIEVEEGANKDAIAEGVMDVLVIENHENSNNVEIVTASSGQGLEEEGGSVESSSNTAAMEEEEDEATTATAITTTTKENHPSIFGDFITEDIANQQQLVHSCIDVLKNSDTNSDGLVQTEEYASFLSSFENSNPTSISRSTTSSSFSASSYAELPYELKVNFLHLSCLCDNACCDQGAAWGIYTGGDLESVCAKTEEVIQNMGVEGSRRLGGGRSIGGGIGDVEKDGFKKDSFLRKRSGLRSLLN